MTSVTDATSTSTTTNTSSTSNSLSDLDLDTFLQLMLVELQNQDPLSPMENDKLLTQISQLREVGATDKLTETLDSVLLGQNITSATNLIGADVTAISDDGEKVSGVVDRVSVDGGDPKLRLQLSTGGSASTVEGEVESGTYSYRVVWYNDDGERFGIELSGDNAVTVDNANGETSIQVANLPITSNRKEIYRTDKTGEGNYQLVGILTDGSDGSFTDRISDGERSTAFAGSFQSSIGQRTYEVSLSNVGEISPPSTSL